MKELERFIHVVERLRDKKNGCPWDSVQTNMSIRRYLVEETGEYLDALEAGDDHAVMDEMGDLLLQVILNAQIAKDEGRFDIEDVARSEADKMIRRHPHVFGDSDAHTEEALRKQWERIKNTEEGYSKRASALDGVPRSMPALARAQKQLSKARRAGFDYKDIAQVIENVDKAMDNVHQALRQDSKEQLSQDIGQLLFSIVKLCHWKDLHAEELLQAAIASFDKRFRNMEEQVHDSGYDKLSDCPEDVLYKAWNDGNASC